MIERSSNHDNRRTFAWLLLPLCVFPLIALVTYDWHARAALQTPPAPSQNWIGALGDAFAYYGYLFFGLAIWTIPVVCLIATFLRLAGNRVFSFARFIWTLVAMSAIAALVQILQTHAPGIDTLTAHVNISASGGVTGYLVMTRLLMPLIGNFGATIVACCALLLALVAIVGPGNILHFFMGLVHWAAAPDFSREDDADDRASTHDDPFAGIDNALPLTDSERRKQERLAAKETKRAAKEAKKQEKLDAQRRIEEDRAAQIEAIRAAREAALRARQSEHAARPPSTPTSAVSAPVKSAAPTAQAPTESDTPHSDKGPYQLPPVSLLNAIKKSVADHSDVESMSKRLIDTLKIFGIDAEVSYTVKGPVVTKYALAIEPGTRYTAVTGLSDNLMGALHAKSLRIEAPIPGEDLIGIEVPNRAPAGISFREIFESDVWHDTQAELPLLFGKRADGRELIADLASMPHMLVAGATGQGKSVCLNALICGLLMTRTPEQLKFIMVDPKCVEFTAYASIPHLMVPVITENRKVVFSLQWAVSEMEKRLKTFARAHVKNIYDYNHRQKLTQSDLFEEMADAATNNDMPATMPYIVIIIDEAADLIGQCGKEVNPSIQRITQKARAAGIHLILATQRPDAKIITGNIKANIPGRVAFKTSSATDSRTILDDGGAENLIGKGDMLFRSKDGLLVRAQGAWISDEEIGRITAFIEEHADTQFDARFTKKLSTIKEEEVDIYADDNENNAEPTREEVQATRQLVKAEAEADDFKKAVECIINTNRASTSHFQRQLGWGYNHAAKILDRLAQRGIVSQPQGIGPRTITMSPDELMAILNGDAENVTEDSAAPEAPSEDLTLDLTSTPNT